MVRKLRPFLLSAIILRAALAAGQTVAGQGGARFTLAPTVPVAGQNAPGVLSPSSSLFAPLSPSLALPVSVAPKLQEAAKAAASSYPLPQAEEGAAHAPAAGRIPAKVPHEDAAAGKAAAATSLSLTASPLRSHGRGDGAEGAEGDSKPAARRQLEGVRDLAASDKVWVNARTGAGSSFADEPPAAASARRAPALRRLLESRRAVEDIPAPRARPGDWLRAELFYRSRQASSYDFYLRLRAAEFRRKLQRWQEKAKGGPTAVEDLEGLLLAWRTKGYNGEMRPLGPGTADREVVESEALEIFDRYYRGQPEARAAFLRYIGRIEQVVPSSRRSHFRKLVFQVFDETALLPPGEVAAHIDGMLSASALEEIRRFRSERMAGVLEDFRALVVPAILETNARLPAGRRILGVVLLGSFAVGLASPSSDMDFQVVTEDGALDQAREFQSVLKKRWAAEGKTNPLSPFEYAVPPNLALLARMHEGYLVFSPYAQVARALAAPPAKNASTAPRQRWRGKLYSFLYSGYLRLYVRIADILERFSKKDPPAGGRPLLRRLLERKAADAPEEAAASENGAPAPAPTGPNLVADLLRHTPDSRVLKLHWTSGGSASEAQPLDARRVFEALKRGPGAMKGSPGLLRRNVHMLSVEAPSTLGDVVALMTGIANLSSAGMGNEYGLLLYADETGRPMFIVQRGGWFVTRVQPHPAIRHPDGRKLLLIGIIAHTHPFGDAIPSQGDHAAIGGFGLFRQKYSILVVPGGRSSLFDAQDTYRLTPAAMSWPLSTLYALASGGSAAARD